MATVEEAPPEAAEKQPEMERYRYVIEKPASDEYRNVQTERAEALEKMFKGEEELPPPLLADLREANFFLKGREEQERGEVKRLIPERYFGDEEIKREVGELLGALGENKQPLEKLVSEAQEAAGSKGSKKLVALKLVGARLLQEHHPEEKGVEWRNMDEEERRTVRLAEMMVHAAEMGALKRRIDNDDLSEDTARVFEKNYSRYARNVDIPQEQRGEYREVAGLLREKVPGWSGDEEELELTPKAEDRVELTPKAEEQVELLAEEETEVAEAEEVLGGEETVPAEQETEVGRAAGDTAMLKKTPESTGERSIKEIEGEMKSVYEQIQEIGRAVEPAALPEGVAVVVKKQPELERLRRRWGELRDEIHTRAAQERLQSVTVDWLEAVEREVEGILGVPLETAEEWAEEHDWEEKGRVEREEKRSKAAPYVKRGKRLKPLRKRGRK